MTKWRKFLHAIFGCRLRVVAWSIMGNPIERCVDCGQHYVTYGCINPQPKPISKQQAREILSEVQ